MLKLLDVIIGVATVMLLYSMVVTVITQFITSVIRSRGRNLRNGIAGLLTQIEPGLDEKVAEGIATAVLEHPMIAGYWGTLGTVIHREELTVLLMELASGQTPGNLSAIEKAALNRLLANNNIPDPAATLSNIRDVALQLEQANPELASHVRRNMAILQEAKSEFVAKIHGWFDQTIDRVSQRFTVTAHGIAFVAALLVAFVVQLDVVALVNRLSVDDAFRAAVLDESKPLAEKIGKSLADQQTSGTGPAGAGAAGSNSPGKNTDEPAPTPSTTPAPTATRVGAMASSSSPSPTPTPADAQLRQLLTDNGLVSGPRNFSALWNPVQWSKIVGILLSAMLLSLGAPFWYGALQNLLKLRSTLSQKDDQQRSERQTSQTDETADGATGAGPLPDILRGEQGDLKALG
jgi:hypothetical protein